MLGATMKGYYAPRFFLLTPQRLMDCFYCNHDKSQLYPPIPRRILYDLPLRLLRTRLNQHRAESLAIRGSYSDKTPDHSVVRKRYHDCILHHVLLLLICR